ALARYPPLGDAARSFEAVDADFTAAGPGGESIAARVDSDVRHPGADEAAVAADLLGSRPPVVDGEAVAPDAVGIGRGQVQVDFVPGGDGVTAGIQRHFGPEGGAMPDCLRFVPAVTRGMPRRIRN